MTSDNNGGVRSPVAHLAVNELAGLIASKDWSATALGDPENWSPNLKLIVGLITASGFPMAVRWGPELILIYNEDTNPFWGTNTMGTRAAVSRGVARNRFRTRPAARSNYFR